MIASTAVSSIRTAKQEKAYIQAPALPSDSPTLPKSEKETMEEFLDDLLD